MDEDGLSRFLKAFPDRRIGVVKELSQVSLRDGLASSAFVFGMEEENGEESRAAVGGATA